MVNALVKTIRKQIEWTVMVWKFSAKDTKVFSRIENGLQMFWNYCILSKNLALHNFVILGFVFEISLFIFLYLYFLKLCHVVQYFVIQLFNRFWKTGLKCSNGSYKQKLSFHCLGFWQSDLFLQYAGFVVLKTTKIRIRQIT